MWESKIALVSKHFRDSGNNVFLREPQPLNAPVPMFKTVLRILTEESFLHFSKASLPITNKPSLSVKDSILDVRTPKNHCSTKVFLIPELLSAHSCLRHKYYYCATYKNKDETDGVYSSVLMLPSYEMNLDEAASYMKKVVYGTGLLKASVENFQVTIDSVYTPLEKDAKTLCEKLKFDGLEYGQSNKPNEKSEVDKLGEDKAPYWLYFEHYHLFRSKMGAASSMEKASGHIFFGIPFVNSYYQLGRY